MSPRDITPPGHLAPAALEEWDRVVVELATLGTLQTADRNVIALHCQAMARWFEAETRLREEGLLITTPNGFPQMNPLLPIANKAMEQVLKTAAELGLSPTARTRLQGKQSTANPSSKPDSLCRLKVRA